MVLALKIRSFLKRPVIQNFSVLTFSNILVQGFNVFTSIKIAKNLMPEGYGFYSFILSLSAIYVVIASLGMRNVIVRGIAINKGDAGKQFTTSLISRTGMFFVVVLAIIVYNSWFSKITLSGWYVFWLCMHIFSMLHWDTVESVTFGHEKMKYSAYINLVLTVCWFGLIMILPAGYIEPYTILVLTVILQLVKTFLLGGWAYANKMFSFVAIPSRREIAGRLKESFPFYVLAIFTLFTSSLPIIYLEHLSTYEEIAYFNIAGRLISPLQLLLFTLLSS
jgi:O-antigen/teichoic acid export membrane protein